MPRNLTDLNDDERKELLNHVWDRLVADEIVSPSGTNTSIASPLGASGKLPHDLAPHLQDIFKRPGAMAASDWKILNASCSAPDPLGALGALGRGGKLPGP